jgi:hypothetical protein
LARTTTDIVGTGYYGAEHLLDTLLARIQKS